MDAKEVWDRIREDAFSRASPSTIDPAAAREIIAEALAEAVLEGRTTQAKLELAARDRFIAERKAKEAEALAEKDKEIARMRGFLESSKYFVEYYAIRNPEWSHNGIIQDPGGVHALRHNLAALLPPDEKKDAPDAP